jgi:aminoglycoside phosphotransferase family enzyme/predicted kinase
MVTEDQSAVIAFLSSPATHNGAPVTVVETHASMVFLAGFRAWKLKRAVRYDYLDFSTTERRREMCEGELRINRRTAPSLYRGVSAITREADGALALDGSGTPVDWVIEMARFDEDRVFDRLAERGALDVDLMGPLATEIARFHLDARQRADHGGSKGMAWVIEGNAAGFASEGAGLLDPALCHRVTGAARAALHHDGSLLEARRRAGFVRQGHGDLHLRNIVLIDGRPTLFDGVEFNDEIACGDVLYDLAFLIMDLWRRGLHRHANVILNGYLSATGDIDGLPLLPLFLSCRAAIRAKTSATAATLQPARRDQLAALAREYLRMADALLHAQDGRVVAIGGLSGTGKTTLARAIAPLLAPVPGALIIRSDEVRKSLAGVPPLTRLESDAYRPEMTQQVYATLLEHAQRVARCGHSVIIDAVFAAPDDRGAIEAMARRQGRRFVGLWLEASEPVLTARVRARVRDASDADVTVVQQQLAQDVGAIDWHRIDASADPPTVEQSARAALGG